MKVRQLQPEVSASFYQSPPILVALRHKKLKLNTQLRWCSLSLVLAYILIVTAGTRYSNQLVSSSGWIPNLMIGSFVLLLISLFAVQYLYAEKETGDIGVSEGELRLPIKSSKSPNQIIQRLAEITIVGAFITILIFMIMLISDRQDPMGFLMFSALLLYLSGLYITKSLLQEKCAINLLTNKFRRNASFNHI